MSGSNRQVEFGAGQLWVTRNDVNLGQPFPCGIFQEITIDFSATNKPLFGGRNFPEFVARGSMKVTGKAKFAEITGQLVNDIFFGQASGTGLLVIPTAETDTIPGTPYQVTVAGGATFDTDLGVYFTLTGPCGGRLTKVASGPTTGQYSVSGAGVYTFAAADTTLGVTITYAKTSTGAGQNQKTTIVATQLGINPIFQAVFMGQYNGNEVVFKFVNCVANKWSLQTKIEDWLIPEIDFDCFVNDAGQLFTWSTIE